MIWILASFISFVQAIADFASASKSWTLTNFKDLAQGVQAIGTVLGLGVAGIWAYLRYVRQGDRWSHVETSADILLLGWQNGLWLVELQAILENKGKVEHRVRDFEFDLAGLSVDDPLEPDLRWGGQIDFPQKLAKGSFLPKYLDYFAVGLGVKARYSFIAEIPEGIAFAMLHCSFRYVDRINFAHAMEKTMRIPRHTEWVESITSSD